VSIEELKAQMKIALEGGDDTKVLELASQIHKAKADITRAEQDKLKAESEKLAGGREKTATAIYQAISKLPEIAELSRVKAFGFTYKVNGYPEGIEPPITYKSVALIVPTVKGKGGGGGSGKTKSEYGMSLSEIVDKYGTPDEKAKIDAAASNSASWQLKTQVKKRVLAEGLIKPTK